MKSGTLFFWSALAWCAAGFALLAVEPGIVLEGFGNPRVPVLVHAFTLGVFVNGYYALQWRVWQRVYRGVQWPLLTLAVWSIHQAGVIAMLAGFLRAGLTVAQAGAHYLVPAGVLLHTVQAVVTMRRRPANVPRHLGAHTPTVGILLTMALGAMVMLDEVTGRYGLFNPPTLLVHGVLGAFLFLFPALRLAEALDNAPVGQATPEVRATTATLLRTAPLALGAILLATGLPPSSGIAGAIGLAVLGATLLWIAPPGRTEWRTRPLVLFRAGWIVPGALLLIAAYRTLRGLPGVEAFTLANIGVVSVLLIAGTPEVLARLQPQPSPTWRTVAGPAIVLGAGIVLLGAQILGSGELVHSAAVVGLAACLWIGWKLRGHARGTRAQ